MLVRGEVFRGKYRNSFEKPEPFTPGSITEVKFDLPDVAHTFKKGHRIMIQVQNSWFPLVDRNPQKFMAIHQAVDLQQEALNSLLDDGAHASEHAARIEALRGEIGQHIGAAVTGLQFQDMTSQLIGRMARHLSGLRDVFGALDVSGTVLPEGNDDAMLAALENISDRVTSRFSGLEGVVRSTVNQRHMESGDIELF